MAHHLMIQGTTSDAGKSAIVTALCRIYSKRGFKVAPFKSQNMALNSAVTADGKEIGRAQALQAFAAGIEPGTDMNPVLLKPDSDRKSQVIVDGRAIGSMDAVAYHSYKPELLGKVTESFRRLEKDYDLIIAEGAGSPAEINLRENDIANMGLAEALDLPVVLVSDIERGGVFAHLAGTLALLSNSEQKRLKGFVINRFRGDVTLLEPGIDWLTKNTGKPTLGVVPYIQGLKLDAEDSLALKQTGRSINHAPQTFRVVVPRLPRISNHTDLDPLSLVQGLSVEVVSSPEEIAGAGCDLIILPGSKAVREDIGWLRANQWEPFISHHLRYHGKVLGICGGFQMMGKIIEDPHGIEGNPGSSAGFGFLDIETTLQKEKTLQRKAGFLSWENGSLEGYEIHSGKSSGNGLKTPFAYIRDAGKTETNPTPDGAVSDDNLVAGTYLHGLFESKEAIETILRWAGFKIRCEETIDYNKFRNQQIDTLSLAVESHLDMKKIDSILGV